MVITAPASTQLPGVSATALRVNDPVLPGDQRTLDRYFDTAASPCRPHSPSWLRIPGISNFDIGIGRNQRFREERINLQFRAELLAAFNHPQLGSPNGSVTPPDFRRITSAGGTRTVQLGLRLSY